MIWLTYPTHNSLAPGTCSCNFKSITFNLIWRIDILNISYPITHRGLPQDLTDDKSTLVNVIAWCGHQANVDPVLCRHLASLCHNELTTGIFRGLASCKALSYYGLLPQQKKIKKLLEEDLPATYANFERHLKMNNDGEGFFVGNDVRTSSVINRFKQYNKNYWSIGMPYMHLHYVQNTW